jgi:hypothetical protein
LTNEPLTQFQKAVSPCLGSRLRLEIRKAFL